MTSKDIYVVFNTELEIDEENGRLVHAAIEMWDLLWAYNHGEELVNEVYKPNFEFHKDKNLLCYIKDHEGLHHNENIFLKDDVIDEDSYVIDYDKRTIKLSDSCTLAQYMELCKLFWELDMPLFGRRGFCACEHYDGPHSSEPFEDAERIAAGELAAANV